MTRRHRKLKSALALLAGITVVTTAAANGASVPMTEASWNQDVHVNAALSANEHAGANYARAAASNGTMVRNRVWPFSDEIKNIIGVVSSVSNVSSPQQSDSGDKDFNEDTLLSILKFESNVRSCARSIGNSQTCPQDPGNSAPSFAVGNLNTISMKVLTGTEIASYQGGPSAPITTTTTCNPGQAGTPFITNDKSFDIYGGKTLEVPTTNGTVYTIAKGITTVDYRVSLTYSSVSETNYAMSQLSMQIRAEGIISNPWNLDLILSRSECGTSTPLREGVVTSATTGNAKTMNAVMDEVLSGDLDEIEAGTLDDALAEADLTETAELATTTTETQKPEDEAEADAEGISASPSTSVTSSTVPAIAQQTVTVTSERTSTSNSGPTSATTSRPSASATRSTSVSATPPSTPPTSEPTTSASAAPAIVIPDEPGTLASNARLEDVETITVGEEELDVVVVKGDKLPSDAKQGARVLKIWLDGGKAGTAWKSFASDDPDDDGWRWAAINQKTGTIVYIR